MIDHADFASLLSAVVDNRGRTCPTSDIGVPLIATNCIKNSTLYPVFEKVRYVDELTMETWFRAHPKAGDIIFVCKGSPGQVCIVPDPVDFCIAQDMVAVRADANKVDPAYLFAALRSPSVQEQINNMHVGTMIPHFKKSDFDKLFIPLPERTVQESIGKFYLTFSRSIDLNQRMNETLETTARAIFRDWFIDFGPTRAKMEGRPAYLASDIWDMFPSKFDEIGKPEGWTEQRFGNLFKLERGLSYKGKFLSDAGVPLVNLGCFAGRGLFEHDRIKSYVGEYAPRHIAPEGTLLLANTDVTQDRVILGSPHIVEAADGGGGMEGPLFTHHIYAARPIKETAHQWTKYLYYHLLQPEVRARIEGFATGTTVLFLPRDAVEDSQFVSPPTSLRDTFYRLIDPLRARTTLNRDGARTLAQTRDFLLPRLMSGEIRLKEAERALEDAA